jgi:hypothetical protein
MPYKDPEVARQKAKERYEKKREEILAKTAQYYEEHKDVQSKKRREWQERNPEKVRAYAKKWRLGNREKHLKNNKDYKDRLRDECFEAYGGKCFCCGVTEKEFLAMDHVFGGGNKHRKEEKIRGGGTIHLYLKRRGYPATFRLSCHNCNMARGFFGICPHELERQAEPGVGVSC